MTNSVPEPPPPPKDTTDYIVYGSVWAIPTYRVYQLYDVHMHIHYTVHNHLAIKGKLPATGRVWVIMRQPKGFMSK